MKISKKNAVGWTFSAILFALVLYIAIGGIRKNKFLHGNREHTEAIIVDFYSGPRLSYYLGYEFFVEETKYQGSGNHYPKTDNLFVGDTIVIVYDKTKPDNNASIRDYERTQEELPFIILFLILITWLVWRLYRKKGSLPFVAFVLKLLFISITFSKKRHRKDSKKESSFVIWR